MGHRPTTRFVALALGVLAGSPLPDRGPSTGAFPGGGAPLWAVDRERGGLLRFEGDLTTECFVPLARATDVWASPDGAWVGAPGWIGSLGPDGRPGEDEVAANPGASCVTRQGLVWAEPGEGPTSRLMGWGAREFGWVAGEVTCLDYREGRLGMGLADGRLLVFDEAWNLLRRTLLDGRILAIGLLDDRGGWALTAEAGGTLHRFGGGPPLASFALAGADRLVLDGRDRPWLSSSATGEVWRVEGQRGPRTVGCWKGIGDMVVWGERLALALGGSVLLLELETARVVASQGGFGGVVDLSVAPWWEGAGPDG